MSIVLNAKPAFLLNWKSAIAKVRLGTSHCNLAYFGDSIPVGAYSDGNIAGLWNQAPSARLAAALNSFGIPAGSANNLNNHSLDASGSLTNFSHWDSRVSVGSGWASDPTNTDEAPGGFWWINSTTINAWSFTPGISFDTVDLSYVKFPGGGTFTVDIDGSASTSVNTNATGAIGVQKVSKGSAGTTVNITRVSGTCIFQGPSCYQDSVKEVHVVNYGSDNALTANKVAVGFPAARNASTMSQKLTIITLGYHDVVNQGATQLQLQTDLTTAVNQAKTVGDVILTTYNPFNTGSVSLMTQTTIRDAQVATAYATDSPVVDFAALFGGMDNYAGAQAAGLMGTDPLHPPAAGYEAMAYALGFFLAST